MAKTKAAKRRNPDLTGHCYNCKKPVTQDDYCSGCKEYICKGCDVNVSLIEPHNVTDHAGEPFPPSFDPRD